MHAVALITRGFGRNFQSLLSLDVSWNDLGEDFMSMQSNLVHQGSLTSLTSLKLNQVPLSCISSLDLTGYMLFLMLKYQWNSH